MKEAGVLGINGENEVSFLVAAWTKKSKTSKKKKILNW
jgi:hypothetical protein